MNKVFKSVWSEALGAWVAASELCRGRGKGGGKVAVALVVGLGVAGGVFAAGAGTELSNGLSPSNTTNTTDIAIGPNATAQSTNKDAIAIGDTAKSTADGAIAIGGGVQNKATNSIIMGNGGTTVNYTDMTSVLVDVASRTVKKGPGEGVDNFNNVATIIGTKNDDVFTFDTQANLVKVGLNGGGGHDTLQKTSTAAGTYDLTTMMAKVTSIEKIDFSTSSAADKITIDFTNLLSRGNETLTLNTGSKDTITMTHNTALDGWTHTTSVVDGHTTDTYALGGHQLIWNH